MDKSYSGTKTVYSNLFFMETTRDAGRWGGTEFKSRLSFKGVAPKLEDIEGSTVVYIGNNFRIQLSEPNTGYGTYYIQKYNKILTDAQFCDFLESHPDEKFLLIDDSHGEETSIWAYTVSEPNQLTIHLFNKMNGDCVMKEIAILKNKFGTTEWETPNILNPLVSICSKILGSKEEERMLHYISVGRKSSKHYEYGLGEYVEGSANISWINSDDHEYYTADLLKRALNIPGQTRIVCKYNGGNSYEHCITANQYSLLSVTERYGIRDTRGSGGYYIKDRFHTDEEAFPDLPLDEEIMSRVKPYMTTILKNKQKVIKDVNFWDTTLVVLDKPVPGHRRPTYHLLYGALVTGGAIDIVDICRGELQIEGMSPVNCYHLRAEDGKYYRISHTFFSKIKEMIQDAEIDITSFEEWNDTRAVHPELVATLATYGDKSVDLGLIRLLNTLPFGVTFIEQLIKTGHVNLGHELARKIRTEADNPNYRCSSLVDILPGVNVEGTTLQDVFGMTKPCYNYLMEGIDEEALRVVDLFIAKYKAVKCYLPDGIFTTAGSKGVEDYLDLFKKNLCWCSSLINNATIDFINYPNEVRTIAKMYNKINKVFGEASDKAWDARRKYTEIVHAYIKIKDLGFEPADQLVFIEFGLGMGIKEALDMLDRREKAANNAIENCQAKLKEPLRKAVEKTYDSRKAAVKKLESDKELQKDPIFNGYVVLAPSKIYDVDDPRSIEHEGRNMDHCVYNAYSRDIAYGDYTVLYLRDKEYLDNCMVTIGIDKHGRINQTYTFHDRPISREQAMAIAAWAKSKEGLVSFQSDSGTVAPGGWNSTVPVPLLSRPDSEWIKKLGTVKEATVDKSTLK